MLIFQERVNTFGSSIVASASSSTTNPVTDSRALRRMWTTSMALQAPVPMSTSSIGRGPRSRPPTSGDASTTTAWPLPASATNDTPSTHVTRAFMTLAPGGAPAVLRGCTPSIAPMTPFVPCRFYASCIVRRNMECLGLSAGSPSSSFGAADAFLHSPPMVESSARSLRPRLFLYARCMRAAAHHSRRGTCRRRRRAARAAGRDGRPRTGRAGLTGLAGE